MKSILTEEMYERIPSMVAAGMKRADIAREFGCTPGTLQVQCSRRRISLRKGGRLPKLMVVPLTDATLQILRQRARSIGINDWRLARNLLEIIICEDLFDAVLDDGPRSNKIIIGELP